jgi:hypothetical protein
LFHPIDDEEVRMDRDPQPGETPAPEEHQPKHRSDDVPIDDEPLLEEFGENPDTELTG